MRTYKQKQKHAIAAEAHTHNHTRTLTHGHTHTHAYTYTTSIRVYMHTLAVYCFTQCTPDACKRSHKPASHHTTRIIISLDAPQGLGTSSLPGMGQGAGHL